MRMRKTIKEISCEICRVEECHCRVNPDKRLSAGQNRICSPPKDSDLRATFLSKDCPLREFFGRKAAENERAR